jgi:hypothetical protein
VPIEDAELSDPEIIRSPLITQAEHDGKTREKKKKKEDEVQDIETNEEDIASDESRPDSPAGGGGDEVNQDEEGEEGDKKEKGKVTPPKDPLIEVKTSNKRKVYPQKPLAQKKNRANKP